jgi:hypothetical protein
MFVARDAGNYVLNFDNPRLFFATYIVIKFLQHIFGLFKVLAHEHLWRNKAGPTGNFDLSSLVKQNR